MLESITNKKLLYLKIGNSKLYTINEKGCNIKAELERADKAMGELREYKVWLELLWGSIQAFKG